jgi:hypothetical protein
MREENVRLASLEFVRECSKILARKMSGQLSKQDFEDALYLLETAANQAERNALEPTEDELRYAARA